MTYRIYGTFLASLSVLALVLAASETLADPGLAHGGGMAPPRPSFSKPFPYHRAIGETWPTAGGVYYGSPNDGPTVNIVPPPKTSDDLRYTCVLDIPWDYVHRCPQPTTPRE